MLSRTALCINHQALSRVNAVSQRILLRNMHVTCHIRNVGIRSNSPLKLSKFAPVLGTCTKRYSSTTKATDQVISSTTDGVASAGVAEGLTSKLIENIPADGPRSIVIDNASEIENLMEKMSNDVENVTTEPTTSEQPVNLNAGHVTFDSTDYTLPAEPSTVNITDDNLPAQDCSVTNTIDAAPTESSREILVDNAPTEVFTPKLMDVIPDAPVVAPTIMDTVALVGEPSLASLGLGSWSPAGMIQQALELLHVSCGLPWWESILIGTVILRLALFPLVIKTQKNNAALGNNMPQLTRLQLEMTQARQEGDQLTASRKARELMNFMKGKDCNPMKNMILPLLQAPIFISVFFGLRKMAELPVESMKEGGLWWFTDLTSADPYYILPLITAVTLFVTIEIGVDGTQAGSMGMARYFLRAMPVVIFPFSINFPAAILCYWVSSNFLSLVQVGVLRIPKVRAFFKIPPLVKHSKVDKVPQKGFIENVKSSYSNMKTARAMNERAFADDVQFQRAGRGPIQQTYAYNPTKELRKPTPVMAKKR